MNPYDYYGVNDAKVYLWDKDTPLSEAKSAFVKGAVSYEFSDTEKTLFPATEFKGTSLSMSLVGEVTAFSDPSAHDALQKKMDDQKAVADAAHKDEVKKAAADAQKFVDDHKAWNKHVNFALHYGAGFNKISDIMSQFGQSLKSANAEILKVAGSFDGIQVAPVEQQSSPSAADIMDAVKSAKKFYEAQYAPKLVSGIVKVMADDGNYYTVQLAEGVDTSVANWGNNTNGTVTFSVTKGLLSNQTWQLLGHTVQPGNGGVNAGVAVGTPVYYTKAANIPTPKITYQPQAYVEGDSIYVAGVETMAEAIQLVAEYIEKMSDETAKREYMNRLLAEPDMLAFTRRSDIDWSTDPKDWEFVMSEDEPIDPSTHQQVFIWD